MVDDAREAPAAPFPAALRDDRVKGILCLLLGVAVFSVQDLVLKFISGGYPLHEALFFRSLTAAPILLALIIIEGGWLGLSTPRLGILLVRGCVMFTAYGFYYLGLSALPMATCVALAFTGPLFTTLISVFALGESVGPRRWAALVIGFVGVIVVLRPGTELFDWQALFPIFSAMAYAVSATLARKLGGVASAATMSFYGNGVFLVGALILTAIFGSGEHADESGLKSMAFLTRGWVMPNATDLALMMLCGVVAAAGMSLLTHAYRIAPVNIIAPFEYSALVWGVLWGFLVFGEMPEATTWIGIATVCVAGLYVLYRERKVGTRSAVPSASETRRSSSSP